MQIPPYLLCETEWPAVSPDIGTDGPLAEWHADVTTTAGLFTYANDLCGDFFPPNGSPIAGNYICFNDGAGNVGYVDTEVSLSDIFAVHGSYVEVIFTPKSAECLWGAKDCTFMPVPNNDNCYAYLYQYEVGNMAVQVYSGGTNAHNIRGMLPNRAYRLITKKVVSGQGSALVSYIYDAVTGELIGSDYSVYDSSNIPARNLIIGAYINNGSNAGHTTSKIPYFAYRYGEAQTLKQYDANLRNNGSLIELGRTETIALSGNASIVTNSYSFCRYNYLGYSIAPANAYLTEAVIYPVSEGDIMPMPNSGTTVGYLCTNPPVLSECFASGDLPTGWSLDTFEGSNGWTISNSLPHYGTYHAYHEYCVDGSNDYMITNSIVVPTTNPVLSYYEASAWSTYYTEGDHEVCISTDGGETWIVLREGLPETVDPGDPDWYPWQEVTIDLSAYSGQTVVIAFHYIGTDATNWYIDCVSVGESVLSFTAIKADYVGRTQFPLKVISGAGVTPPVCYEFAYIWSILGAAWPSSISWENIAQDQEEERVLFFSSSGKFDGADVGMAYLTPRGSTTDPTIEQVKGFMGIV